MSFPFTPFASSSYSASYSSSYTKREIEDSERTYKLPAKPRAQKKPTQKKTLKNREDFIEKIEHFACKICHKTYTNKGSLTRHLTTVHGLDKGAKDAKKPKATATKSLGTRAPSRLFRCKVCKSELSSNASLIRHMATQHDKACESKPKTTKVSKTNVYLNVINNHTSYHNATPSQSMDMAVRRNNYDSY